MPKSIETALSHRQMSRPLRWDNPFDSDLSDEDVDEILGLALFREMDQDQFPSSLPLAGIVKNDMRFGFCRRGDILVREGDYGNSAFVVLDGSVAVVLPPGLSNQTKGRIAPETLSWFSAVKRYFTRSPYEEVRVANGRYIPSELAPDTALRGQDGQARVYLKDPDAIKRSHSVVTLGVGELFGEVAALARTPRKTTIFADQDVRVLEIRWQGLRDIRRYVDSFREKIDALYRDRNLVTHLKEITLFSHLDENQLNKIAKNTLFESHGNFDWHTDFNRDRSKSLLSMDEHVIADQGDYLDGLLFIRSGFATVSQKINNGKKTLSVASSGHIFGLEELFYNSEQSEPIPYQSELSAIGYADVLRVPTSIIEELVLPSLSESEKNVLRGALDKLRENAGDFIESNRYSDFIEFSVDNRYINGTATMMIDSDRCTRCDECVHACANSHGGNPRFVRHGKQHEKYIVANACMHCVDPVCMIGCPTGAIHRSQSSGEVVINDASCIGCATCANSCPYDNIRMVEVREGSGEVVLDDKTKAPIMKATKCDLCFNLPGGPACERACPHGALSRLDMSDSASLMKWLDR